VICLSLVASPLTLVSLSLSLASLLFFLSFSLSLFLSFSLSLFLSFSLSLFLSFSLSLFLSLSFSRRVSSYFGLSLSSSSHWRGQTNEIQQIDDDQKKSESPDTAQRAEVGTSVTGGHS